MDPQSVKISHTLANACDESGRDKCTESGDGESRGSGVRESGLTGCCQGVSGSGLGFGTLAWETQSTFVAPEHTNKTSLCTERELRYAPFPGGLRCSHPLVGVGR